MYPGQIKPENITAISLFVNFVNQGLFLGNFEIDLENGKVRYKTSIDMDGIAYTDEIVMNLIYANIAMVDRYFAGIDQFNNGEDPKEAIRLCEEE